MSKVDKEKVFNLVSKTMSLGFTTQESLSFINERLEKPISRARYFRVKEEVIQLNHEAAIAYIKQHGDYYFDDLFKQVNELEILKAEHLRLHETENLDPRIKSDLILKSFGLAMSILELTTTKLPQIIMSVVDWKQRYDKEKNEISC